MISFTSSLCYFSLLHLSANILKPNLSLFHTHVYTVWSQGTKKKKMCMLAYEGKLWLGWKFVPGYHFNFLVEDGMSVKKLHICFGILDIIVIAI